LGGVKTKKKYEKPAFYATQNRSIRVPNTHGQFCLPPPSQCY